MAVLKHLSFQAFLVATDNSHFNTLLLFSCLQKLFNLKITNDRIGISSIRFLEKLRTIPVY
jgi:hypothetical protein